MSAITRMRQAGFRVRLLNGRKLGVTPIEQLTGLQRMWIVSNRDELIAELTDESANDERNNNIELRPDRWTQFVDLAVKYAVGKEEVVALFTDMDIADLLEEPDEKLPLHARTIGGAIKSSRKPAYLARMPFNSTGSATLEEPQAHIFRPPVRTCGNCQHYVRTEHPRLGHYAIQAESEAPVGHWDTERRDHCQQYTEGIR